MESDEPELLEAIAIKHGKIIYVGNNKTAKSFRAKETVIRDLKGRFMMPGFVDSHSHLATIASLWNSVHVDPPPGGNVVGLQQLLDTLQYVFQRDKPSFLFESGYDEKRFLSGEMKHPTREDLDKISRDTPIVVLHYSLHMGVANTKALELAGVLIKGFANPAGGKFLTDDSGSLNGIFEEGAVFSILPILPLPQENELRKSLQAAVQYYLKNGITTAQEGHALEAHYQLLRDAALNGQLPLDVVAYLKWSEFDRLNAQGKLKPGQYEGRFKLGGVKIILDGSPQIKTAFVSQPYQVCPEEGKSCTGYTHLSYQEFAKLIRKYHENNVQAIVHCSGDSAAGWMIEAIKEAEKNKGKRDLRFTMVHAQMLRIDQLGQLKEHRIYPTFFPSHTYYWGDWHRASVMGEERSSRISPLQSALKRNILFGIHTDAPVTTISQLDAIQRAVLRETSSGFVLGEDERINVYTALKASTIWGAYMYHEENKKGTIAKGKLADLIILDADPLKIHPKDISKIKVLETIKEGKTVYQVE
jgi:predicted amidohydrolase YtcJ